jgi:rod shape-determining protein MreC
LKKSYVFIALALLIIVIIGATLSPGAVTTFRQWALTAVAPAVQFSDWVRSLYSDVNAGLTTLDAAQAEVVKLRSENARLATENSYLIDLRKENNRLREMLGFKQASQYRLMTARVVSRDPSNWWNTVMINRGWSDDENLTPDLPVVTPRGIVGKTGTVSRSVTEVILMVNENCKISCVIEGSREQGIIVGEGVAAEGKPKARMKFIARNAEIAVGERVFTSGLGGVFPSGLLLGTIEMVPPLSASENFGLYREAVLDTAVDPSQLDELFVVIGAK